MEKKCTICKKTKDLSNFYKNRTRTDGHDNICRECRRKLYRKQRGNTPRTSIEDYTMQEILDEIRRRQEPTPNS